LILDVILCIFRLL